MKTFIAVSMLLFAGCESSKTHPPITAERATTLSVQLANEKAAALYHRRPFENKKSARFEDGRWTWNGSHGVGTLDFQATVQLAADGSTNNVDIRVQDDALKPMMR